ncbi:Acg family FMN-binding oxidoreductase [Actinoplanes solisilvae]|uniref:Acg family FMN-binding oxidoreductase n=1 Tax=Actinoplanes solisilvae TaxID=2486853 RepID=UPI000FD72FFC|nr:nitroreductase [Actinoplanes solisilvae]
MTPLERAATAALHAPSVFNTQPWIWQIDGDVLELRADLSRRLEITDRDGRMLVLSCGAALHHALTALSAAGWSYEVTRLPDPSVLARVTLGSPVPVDPAVARLAEAIPRRRTDRRPFGARTVPDAELTRLRLAVEARGAYLHVVTSEQVAKLGIAASLASDAELTDPRYRAELREWTSDSSSSGIPPATAVSPGLRRVPVRDFAPDGEAGLAVGSDHDEGAAYVVLFGLGDDLGSLLRGGEALSALLLLATADGLATAPLSDAIEVEWPRVLVRGLLAGVGEPYVAVRLGYPSSATPLPERPRRTAADVIVRL